MSKPTNERKRTRIASINLPVPQGCSPSGVQRKSTCRLDIYGHCYVIECFLDALGNALVFRDHFEEEAKVLQGP
jgi:hypothetical protein